MLNTIVFRCWPGGQINLAALSRIHFLRSQLILRAADYGRLSGDLQALIEEWEVDRDQVGDAK